MSESYHDFIAKTLGIELETWQHDLIKHYAERYSMPVIEAPKFRTKSYYEWAAEVAPGNYWGWDYYAPPGYNSSEVQGEPMEFSIVDEILEQKRRWTDPTDEERAEDRRRDEERDRRIQDIIEGREDPLYAPVSPSKPLWEEPRAPLNRAERRAAKSQNPKEV